MAVATLTSKGQITVPQPVRDRLGLKAGDQVDFVFQPDGRILFAPKKLPFERLRGLLRSRRKKPVSVRAMHAAILRAVRAEWRRTDRSSRS